MNVTKADTKALLVFSPLSHFWLEKTINDSHSSEMATNSEKFYLPLYLLSIKAQ